MVRWRCSSACTFPFIRKFDLQFHKQLLVCALFIYLFILQPLRKYRNTDPHNLLNYNNLLSGLI